MIDDLLDHFGSQYRMAKELGVDRGAVSQWVKNHTIPPQRLIQLERLTEGKFKAVDLDDWQQSMLTPTIGNKYPLPTDKQIAEVRQKHCPSFLSASCDKVRVAFAFLDAQKTVKVGKTPCALKHYVESWSGLHISKEDVEVAAILHPDIEGEYPYYNLSANLIMPCYQRLNGLKDAFKDSYPFRHTDYTKAECPEQHYSRLDGQTPPDFIRG
jgi:hypothetical protein